MPTRNPAAVTDVLVHPSGIRIPVALGETVMGAAQAQGYYWPTVCGGQGICTSCTMTVRQGAELLSPVGRSERRTLTAEGGEGTLRRGARLACQARVVAEGLITVDKPGVRRADETPF